MPKQLLPSNYCLPTTVSRLLSPDYCLPNTEGEAPQVCTDGTQAVVRPPIRSNSIGSPFAVVSAVLPQR